MIHQTPAVHFVVALLPEAKPLIDHFGLDAAAKGQFQIYELGRVRLIVSGVGEARSSAAAEFIYTHSGQSRNVIWLNVGLAGHRDFEIGGGVLAHKITDRGSGKNWYPPIVFRPLCETRAVLTVDRPEKQFSEDSVYDMEASGFYDTATRFSTAELVHVFKVVSDNHASGLKVTARSAERLIGNQLQTIENILQCLKSLSRDLPATFRTEEEFERIKRRWHFTVTQQHQLKRLLMRLKTLEPKGTILSRELKGFRGAGEVLRSLERRIDLTPVRL